MVKDRRKNELAKIHIAKKDLGLDEVTYRHIIREVGRADSGSSRDLDEAGRKRVIAHYRSKGWRPQKSSHKAPDMASDEQIRLIYHLWAILAETGVVRNNTATGLRTWLTNATRRYSPDRAGYNAPEFLPKWVATKVIEHLKQWAKRWGVEWSK